MTGISAFGPVTANAKTAAATKTTGGDGTSAKGATGLGAGDSVEQQVQKNAEKQSQLVDVSA